jgi:hypothetical protein
VITWTLWLLLHTSTGEWVALEGRSYKDAKKCAMVATGIKGRPISNAVVYTAVCREKTDV